MSEEEHIWERVEARNAEGLKFAVTGTLKFFENREELIEYIEDLGATVTGSISKKTDYLINNDVHSKTSKNAKAKELKIPVITEAEFIARFADPDDYDVDDPDDYDTDVCESSPFWYDLGERLVMNDAEECDYEEVIDALYAHSKWIDGEDLRRAAYSIADMAAETDPEYRSTLMDHIAGLESSDNSETNDEE